MNVSAEQPAPPRARLGLAALMSVLALWVVFVAATALGGYLPSNVQAVLAPLAAIASYVVGVALAVTSLVRREPRKLAIVTLVLLFAGPLLFGALVLLVWWGYGLGMR